MEAVKKHWLWGVFISILSIFAMSYNVNAIGVFNYSNYELVETQSSLKINSDIYNFNNTEKILECRSSWSCSYTGTNYLISVINLYTDTAFNYKKGDIVQFDVSIYTDTPIGEMYGFRYLNPALGSEFTILSVENNIVNQFNSSDSSNTNYAYNTVYTYTVQANRDMNNLQFGWKYNQHIFKYSSASSVRYVLGSYKQFRFIGSEENREQEEKTQEAVDESQEVGGDSSTDAQTGTTGLISAIGSAVNVIAAASPTNCKINGNMGNLNMGELDLCANPAPAFIQTIGSLILILMCVPLAISLFNRFISLFRSFQS